MTPPPPPDADPYASLAEDVVDSVRHYEGHIVNLRVDRVRFRNGRQATREVVEHAEAVCVLALEADGRIPFVRQWRIPARRVLLELPAGGIDTGETPAQAAARELQEEVGLRPGRLERLFGFWVAPGWAEEYLHAFLATDCVPAGLPADHDEQLLVERYTLAEALAFIRSGEMQDAKSLALVQALALRGR